MGWTELIALTIHRYMDGLPQYPRIIGREVLKVAWPTLSRSSKGEKKKVCSSCLVVSVLGTVVGVIEFVEVGNLRSTRK